MDISVVIPNYNGKNLLEKNLPKILDILSDYKEGKAEVIIVDDYSTDESLNFISKIQQKSLDVKLISNTKNLGFSSTVNKGVAQATGDIVILLNTDVSPEDDFLAPLLLHFKDPIVFAVGCLDKSVEKDKTVLRGRGLGSWQRGFLVHHRGEVDKTNTLWVSGGSSAFRKSTWDKLGGLNEIYNPFYYEDIDLSYRALKSGYTIFFEPKSIVIHEHELGAIKTKYSKEKVKRIAYRNQFIFVWENATDYPLRLAHLLWLPYHLVKAITRADIQFFLGFFDALIFLPKVIKSKSKAQKYFVKTDKEIIKNLYI
jgi:GT2 family glycosyltransferase